MTISEKVAYLKGLAEGLNLDVEKSKEGKLISVMIGILEEVGLSIEDLEENALALGEEIDTISDDLADVESVVYGEDEDEDDYFEVECPNCEEPIVIDDKALAEGEVECPNCQTKFSLDLSDDTVQGVTPRLPPPCHPTGPERTWSGSWGTLLPPPPAPCHR